VSKIDQLYGVVSPRQKAALEIADTLECLGLNDCYGVQCERAVDSKGKGHWSILFCKARLIDGHVRVYSDRFIMITIQQRSGVQKFTSPLAAKRYLVQTFKEYI
jgi:hypothetical protein